MGAPRGLGRAFELDERVLADRVHDAVANLHENVRRPLFPRESTLSGLVRATRRGRGPMNQKWGTALTYWAGRSPAIPRDPGIRPSPAYRGDPVLCYVTRRSICPDAAIMRTYSRIRMYQDGVGQTDNTAQGPPS